MQLLKNTPRKSSLIYSCLLLSLQLSEVGVHEGSVFGAQQGLVLQLLKTNLDGQLSLQLSKVGIHEAYAALSWV